jgi:hypothetical protein
MFFAYRSVQRAVRDDRWKLIRYPAIHKTQLFDLVRDPDERVDLSSRPEYSGELARLTEILREEMRHYGDGQPLSSPVAKPAAWSPPVQEKRRGP